MKDIGETRGRRAAIVRDVYEAVLQEGSFHDWLGLLTMFMFFAGFLLVFPYNLVPQAVLLLVTFRRLYSGLRVVQVRAFDVEAFHRGMGAVARAGLAPMSEISRRFGTPLGRVQRFYAMVSLCAPLMVMFRAPGQVHLAALWVSVWLAAVLVTIIYTVLFRWRAAAIKRLIRGECHKCRYEVGALATCPECGVANYLMKA